jgi:hypothetical protein
VAFDRKETGSVVTRQKARYCCSPVFADVLSLELTKLGVPSSPDPKAYYTDTATFLDTIPECTNISAGGWREHYNTEWVDLSYTKKVAEAACNIDWEKLPTERVVIDYKPKYNVEPRHRFINKDNISSIKKILNSYGLMHTNKLEFETYTSDTLVFNTWFEDLDIRISIVDDILVQIEGFKDIRFSLNEVYKLNIYFGNIFGIEISPKDYKMGMSKSGEFDILGNIFKSIDEYIEHFDSINSDDTSFVVKKGGVQYKMGDDNAPKELVIKWFNENTK